MTGSGSDMVHGLHILTSDDIAPELSKVLEIPHTLETIPENDADARRLILEADVLVSARFKPEWRAEETNKRLRLVH